MLFRYKVRDKAPDCRTTKAGYAPLALVPDLIGSVTSVFAAEHSRCLCPNLTENTIL